ncbi:MAG TPA: type II secretion system protein [Longimicrobiaceae bacterium]|nr:type II secretion system protein [Longimicrobiaceae bacterium]
MRARFADRRGFTLVEAVVALLIVAVALVPLLGSVRQALQGAARVAPARDAVALAEWKMEELSLLPADSLGGYLRPREGAFPEPFAAWRWRAVMRIEPSSPALLRASVIVDSRAASFSLETVFHRPEMLPQFGGPTP